MTIKQEVGTSELLGTQNNSNLN